VKHQEEPGRLSTTRQLMATLWQIPASTGAVGIAADGVGGATRYWHPAPVNGRAPPSMPGRLGQWVGITDRR
jgi:hypothetical protein